MSCGVGWRHGLDPTLLWHRPAAEAPIRPLAWELPYAKKKKKKVHVAKFSNLLFNSSIIIASKLKEKYQQTMEFYILLWQLKAVMCIEL